MTTTEDYTTVEVDNHTIIDFYDGGAKYRLRAIDLINTIDRILGNLGLHYQHIWNLFQVDRAGHSAVDPLLFQSVFNVNLEDVAILIPKGRPIANKAYIDTFFQGAKIVEWEDLKFLYIMHIGRHVLKYGGRVYYFIGRYVGHIYRNGLPNGASPPLKLPILKDMSRVDRSLKRYGVEPKSYVVLHNRESGFFRATHHNHRDSAIETLIKAVKSFQQRGLKVIRIGDSSMRRLPHDLGVQEIQFNKDRDEFDDIALISNAWLYFGTSSGPLGIAEVLGTPILGHNYTSYPTRNSNNCEFVMKRYFDARHNRFLSYFEIFTSWIGFSQVNEELVSRDIQILSNTPDELDLAVNIYLDEYHLKNRLHREVDHRFIMNKTIDYYNLARGKVDWIFDPAYSTKTIPSRLYETSSHAYFLGNFLFE